MTTYIKLTSYRFREKKDELADYIQHLKNDVANSIKEVMKDRNLNQAQLAELTGFKKGQMSRILCGKVNLTLKTLNKIAQGIGLKWTVKTTSKKQNYNKSWCLIKKSKIRSGKWQTMKPHVWQHKGDFNA